MASSGGTGRSYLYPRKEWSTLLKMVAVRLEAVFRLRLTPFNLPTGLHRTYMLRKELQSLTESLSPRKSSRRCYSTFERTWGTPASGGDDRGKGEGTGIFRILDEDDERASQPDQQQNVHQRDERGSSPIINSFLHLYSSCY